MAIKRNFKTEKAEFLDPSVRIRVVRVKGNESVEKIMTIAEWREFKKQAGYNYFAYQLK